MCESDSRGADYDDAFNVCSSDEEDEGVPVILQVCPCCKANVPSGMSLGNRCPLCCTGRSTSAVMTPSMCALDIAELTVSPGSFLCEGMIFYVSFI